MNTKQKYENLVNQGKVKDEKKKAAIKKMVTQLDSQIMEFDSFDAAEPYTKP